MGRLTYSGDFTGGLISHVEASAYVNYFDTHLATINTTSAKQTVFSDSHVIGPVVIGGRVLAVAPWSIDGFGSVVTKFGGDAFYERRPGSLGTSITATLSNGVVTALRYSPLTQSVPESFQTNGGIFMLHEWTPFEALTVSAGGRLDYFNTRTRLSPLPSAALLSAYVANSDTDRLAPTGSIGARAARRARPRRRRQHIDGLPPSDQRRAVQFDGDLAAKSQSAAGDRRDL